MNRLANSDFAGKMTLGMECFGGEVTMLKGVALIGESQEGLEAHTGATANSEVSLITSSASDPLPQYADASLTTGDPVAALAIAMALAERHVTVLNLLAEAIDCREQLPQGSSARACDHASRLAKAIGLNEVDQLSVVFHGSASVGRAANPSSVPWLLLLEHL